MGDTTTHHGMETLFNERAKTQASEQVATAPATVDALNSMGWYQVEEGQVRRPPSGTPSSTTSSSVAETGCGKVLGAPRTGARSGSPVGMRMATSMKNLSGHAGQLFANFVHHVPHPHWKSAHDRHANTPVPDWKSKSAFVEAAGHDADGGVAPLAFTGKFAGGIRADIKRRAPFYWDDWVEPLRAENRSKAMASCVFLFFACLSPAVTFGMLFQDGTDGQLGVVEVRRPAIERGTSTLRLPLRALVLTTQVPTPQIPSSRAADDHLLGHLRHPVRALLGATALHPRRDGPRARVHRRLLQDVRRPRP